MTYSGDDGAKVGSDGVKRVDLWYPRNEGSQKRIDVSLMDVRAANDISITYDFKRDGWVISSNCDPGKDPSEYTKEEWDALPDVEGQPGYKDLVCRELYEVAFIPSWPERKEIDMNEVAVRFTDPDRPDTKHLFEKDD